MDDTAAGRHPLHATCFDGSAMASRVFVNDFAFQHVAHGLETAVRMVGRANGLTGLVFDGAQLVDQQERIERRQTGRG